MVNNKQQTVSSAPCKPSHRAAGLVASAHEHGERGEPEQGAAAGSDGNTRESPLRVLRRVLSNLPVVGLIAQIVTPGGVAKKPEELSFQEYAFIMGDEAPSDFGRAISELPAENKTLLLLFWMASTGPNAKTDDGFMRCANRLRLSGSDVEMEMNTFEQDRLEAAEENNSSTIATRAEQETLADAMVRVVLTGSRDGMIGEDNEQLLQQALTHLFFPFERTLTE